MAGQEKKRNPRSAALILDLLHIVIGILVVICAILVFGSGREQYSVPRDFLAGSPAERYSRRIPVKNERTR